MKKILFLMTTACSCCFANPQMGMPEIARTFYVQTKDFGDSFAIGAKTRHDMPNAVGLELASLNVTHPHGPIPGLISMVVKPQGDVWIEMVGPQKGRFIFKKGENLAQAIPHGRYRLEINGEVYGILLVKEHNVHLVRIP